MKVFLIRHGQSLANAEGVHQGQKVDSPLSSEGKEQAHKLAKRLADEKVEIIYSSDLLRAKTTAEIISNNHIPIILDKRLREFDSGDFTKFGSNLEIYKKYKEEESIKRGVKPHEVVLPGGESEHQHWLRIEDFVNDVLLSNLHQNIAIVAHGGTNKIFFGVTKHLSREKMYEVPQNNCCLNEIEYDGKNWKVHKINCLVHL